LEDVKLFFEDPINNLEIASFETLEKNGGRIEKRVCRATGNIEWFPDLPLWSGLRTIFSITRTTILKGKTTEETGYYISSLADSPKVLLAATRAHWKIELIMQERLGTWGGSNTNDNRIFINACLWNIRTGAPWRELPPQYGTFGAVNRRYKRWCDKHHWDFILAQLGLVKKPRI
jgi:hypothetical protein